jgi:uncharacterized iron-regulated membrane protein
MLRTADLAREANRRTLPPTQKGRPLLVTLHLWLGLSLGSLLVLIALSGSTMIFRYELERIFFSSLTHTSASGAFQFDACLAAAQAVNPRKSVRTLRIPANADGTFEWTTIPIGQTVKDQATVVYTDPHTCAVLGTRGPRKDIMSFLVNFHHALFMGKNGAYLQTCFALTAIFMAISGLILWWPKNWAWSRLRPRASARPLHYSIGFWAMFPLLVIATTAIYMAWRSEINKSLLDGASTKNTVAKVMAETTKADGEVTSKSKKSTPSLSLDKLMVDAKYTKPDATWRILTLPIKPKDPGTITYQLPGEYGRTGNNQIAFRQNPDGSPRISSVSELRQSSRMKRFLTGLMQIHYGEFGGITSRLLWCAMGFMPTILFTSGLLMYRRRIRSADAVERAFAAKNV